MIVMYRRLLSVFLIMLCSVSMAQNKGVFHGHCIDLRRRPIEGVNVYSSDSLLLSISDKNGNFTVKNAKEGDTLCLSHLTYEYAKFIIEKEDFAQKEVPVMLKESFYGLMEIEVLGSRPKVVYRNRVNSVIDYEFNDMGFYMIAYRQDGGCSLLHTTLNFDTLSILPIRRKFQRLYKDVYDQIHLIGPDSTYQIGHRQFRGHYMNMELFYGMRLNEFYDIMGNNVLVNNKIFVVADYGEYGQEIYYNFYEIGKPKGYALNHVCDKGGLDLLENYRKFGVGKEAKLFRAIYDPVFELNDTIFLFDFEDDKIIYYDNEANRIGSGWMTFHREWNYNQKWVMKKDWKKLVLLDKYQSKFYAVFEKDGVMVLKRINFKADKAEEVAKLTGFSFVTNPQVRDGMLYFLYADDKYHAKKLFRMRIDGGGDFFTE